MIRAQMRSGYDAESFLINRLAADHGVFVYPILTSREATIERIREGIRVASCADEIVGKHLCGALETYAVLFERIYSLPLKTPGEPA